MSLLDKAIPNINTSTIKPSKYVKVPTRATAAETGSKMTSWYNWLVNHVPATIKKNVSSTFSNVKEQISSLYKSPVMKPTKYVEEPIRKNATKVNAEMQSWNDWLLNHIPEFYWEECLIRIQDRKGKNNEDVQRRGRPNNTNKHP